MTNMALLKTFLFSACLFQFSNAGEVTDITKEWDLPLSGHIYKRKNPIIGNNNVLAYYKSNEDLSKVNDRNYILNYEKFDKSGITYHYKCPIHLHSEIDGQLGSLIMATIAGNKIWTSYSYYKNITDMQKRSDRLLIHRVTDMITCDYHESKILIEIDHEKQDWMKDDGELGTIEMLRSVPAILPKNDGSYELFIFNRTTCNAARCRYSVDANGTISDNVIPYLPKEYSTKLIQMFRAKTDNHYFAMVTNNHADYVNENHYDFSLLYAMPEGKVEELLHVNDEKNIFDIDDTHGHVTVCWTNKISNIYLLMNVYCVQYNSEKQQTMNKTLQLPYVIDSLKVKNMPNGGFLLSIGECDMYNQYNREFCQRKGSYYLKYIQLEEKHGPVIEIKENVDSLKRDFRLDYEILSYEDGGNICLSVMSDVTINFGDGYKKHLWRKCFSEKLLTATND